ncbi:MAG: DNA polymerase IV [Deltaproteobacteria bacterium]|nr:DNA polymerase IV [Deltaproteobacteria bacterium]
MNRIIFHIDMDAFYASIEQSDNPTLRGRPVVVGGTSNRGVVSAASYEARRYGVRSAMPIFQARQKCPDAIFLSVRMERYKEVSRHIMNILESFSPLIEQVSIDEAYIDLTGTDRLLEAPEEVALMLKQRIKEETSLTCSIGIAPNKFLAKISSDMNKPDGLTIISVDDVPRFIDDLPIEKVPGVGGKTVQILHDIGVSNLVDIKRLEDRLLIKKTGKFGKRLIQLSRGIDESPVAPYTESKSISSEDTFTADTNDMTILKEQLLVQAEIVGRRLREKGFKGTTVTLKMKRADFKQMTRSVTLDEPTYSSQSIYEHGLKLLETIDTSNKYRLIGIGVSNLATTDKLSKQLNLFDNIEQRGERWENAEKAMDTIQDKFGRDAIKRGRLLHKNDPQIS